MDDQSSHALRRKYSNRNSIFCGLCCQCLFSAQLTGRFNISCCLRGINIRKLLLVVKIRRQILTNITSALIDKHLDSAFATDICLLSWQQIYKQINQYDFYKSFFFFLKTQRWCESDCYFVFCFKAMRSNLRFLNLPVISEYLAVQASVPAASFSFHTSLDEPAVSWLERNLNISRNHWYSELWMRSSNLT